MSKRCSLQYVIEMPKMSPGHLQSVDFEGADLSNALLVEVEVAQPAARCMYPLVQQRQSLGLSSTVLRGSLQTSGAQFRKLKSIEGAWPRCS